ncbi:MAG: hypothetical protein OQJ98_01880 [Candidatus Pacebacteria bacterium]|nr:hypothetical protein [Candidatus Paceibacterota bacterium]
MSIEQTLLALAAVLALGGTYAWVQFVFSLLRHSSELEGKPLRSKCFIGAVIFTLGFLLAIHALRSSCGVAL